MGDDQWEKSKGDRAGPPSAKIVKRRNWRPIIGVMLGVIALLCLGGAGIFFVVYDRATEPRRSSPDVVVDQYLESLLIERNPARTSLYTCRSGARLTEIEAFRDQLESQEKAVGSDIMVTYEDLQILTQNDVEAEIAVAIRRSAMVDGVRQSLLDQWRLTIVKGSDWRVCGAVRVG